MVLKALRKLLVHLGAVGLMLMCSSMTLQAEPAVDGPLAGIDVTVNINTASAEELAALLKGIGLKKAQAMVDYRDAYGDFVEVDDMIKVKGIGKATVEKNRSRLML